ncbi:MAG TPA: hypothetical protein VFC33_18340 [Acidimicrobiia bacterium]|nr:hypothetical protein [Acidimicrobiia bacterium]
MGRFLTARIPHDHEQCRPVAKSPEAWPSGAAGHRATRHAAPRPPVGLGVTRLLRIWKLWCAMQDDLPQFGDDAE